MSSIPQSPSLPSPLQGRHVLVGVTGSIAAYKACDLVQRLKERGADVRVVMTRSAAGIIHPNALAALTGAPVLTDAWEGVSSGAMPHIDAARWADLFLVAPCTAHTLAELSLGLTGSPLSMTALAYSGPLAVAPAMNTVMLTAVPVQEHLARLRARGVHILPTGDGTLACGEIGDGKFATPEEITAYAELILALSGKGEGGGAPAGLPLPAFGTRRVLVSGGHTEEPLDGVRYLANRSSGKTALALARAFRLCGADVHLVLGRADEAPPAGIRVTRVRTSADFQDVMAAAAPQADAVVMAAAIADFVPAASATDGKWKASRELRALELSPAPNILDALGKARPAGQVLVGFALEAENAVAYGLEKLRARRCDLVVVNTPLHSAQVAPGAGFGGDAVEAALLAPEHAAPGAEAPVLRLQSKAALAADVVRAVAARLSSPSAGAVRP